MSEEEIQRLSDDELENLDLDFDQSDVRAAAHRPVISLGPKRFVVTDAERTDSKNGHLMIRVQLMPLDGSGPDAKPHQPSVTHNIILPFKNSKVPGHKPPNTAYMCTSFLKAIYPDELPPLPVRSGEGVWTTHDGRMITDYREVSSMREVQAEKVFTKLKELWKDPQDLLEETFYGIIVQNGQYRNLATGKDGPFAEPLTDWDVQYEPEMFKEYVE